MCAHARLHVRVARETPAETGKFRRRIPLELTAQELALLEREERRFGTKRATLVAGLQALARVLGLERELEQALRERDEACAVAEAEAGKARTAEATLSKTKQEASSAKRGKSEAERKRQKRADDAQVEIAALSQALADEAGARLTLERELEELEAELLLGAHCPRCGTWAKHEEWAVQVDGEFELLYHRPCGFHREDGLRGRSVFGYRKRG